MLTSTLTASTSSQDTLTITSNDTTTTTDPESAESHDTDATATTIVVTDPGLENMENPTPLMPWTFKNVDVAELFTRFRQSVREMSSNRLVFIESSVHELLALSNILLLCPDQHSSLCMNVFTEDVLSDLTKELLAECMDLNQDMTDHACMKLSRIINNVESNIQSKDDAEFDLLVLGKDLNSLGRSLVRGITAGMRKLPLVAIESKETIGECELFTMYFDPILSALLSNPDRNVLLRWSNVTSDEAGKMRPDATISKILQCDFGSSLGFGEVKLARPSIDHHALCHDILRLAIFAKDTVDKNKLHAALTFQINEIGQLTFPRSLKELASFVNLKNMRTLLMVSEVFWRLCQPVDDEDYWKPKRRPTHPAIYSMIDATKDRHRVCALRFE
ncbi:hypothetical protein DFQ30_005271 [Apophysomyces sp. BC1015]|nr:hypothetical protein DFQ30_005271 [Apophysomyces sp. BC1015]